MKKILVLGATSAIAEAACRLWAKRGDALFVVARNEERLRAIAADLKVRGAADVHVAVMDLDDIGLHDSAVREAARVLGGLDLAFIAHGTLGDQTACTRDFSLALRELNTNAIGVMSWLTHLGNLFESQGGGTIAVISSVAGDRGRQSNYVYGAAKGAVTIFMQGMRQRLYKAGVNVVTIKPGFVDTPMTASFKKGVLWTSPGVVAAAIDRAISRGSCEVYVPSFWWLIMTVIKAIPERLFRRASL